MISKHFQEELIKVIFNFLESKYPLEEFTRLYDLEGGYAFKSQTYTDKGIFVLRVTNIEKNSEINKEDAKYFPEDKIDHQLKKFILKEGDVLVVMVGGSLGKVGFVTKKDLPAILNQNMWRIRSSKEKLDPKYTYYLTRHINHSKIKIRSSTHGHMSREMYKQIKIPEIDGKTQVEIANYLGDIFSEKPSKIPHLLGGIKSKIDKIILLNNFYLESGSLNKDNENSITKLRQQILQDAVQGKLVKQDLKDEPTSELLKKIKSEKDKLIKEGKIRKEKPLAPISEDEIPYELPKGWEWVRLVEICQINPRNSLDDKLEVAFIPMTLIEDGFNNKHSQEIKKWGEIKSGFTHFAENDVVFAKITPCFQNRKSAILHNLKNKYGAGTTELYVLRIYAKTIIPEILLYLVKTDDFIEKGVASYTGTAGQQRVKREFFENLIIGLPPLAEQKRIVEKVDKLMAYCDDFEKQVKENRQNSEKLMEAVLKESFEK